MVTTHYAHKSFRSMAKDAIEEYFSPIRFILSLLDQKLSAENKKKELEIKYVDSKNVLKVIQKAICFNQGEYLQYTFVTAEKHRLLKDTFRKNKNDRDKILFLAKDLVDYINCKFYENTHENFKLLHAYFNLIHGTIPRICIKGNFRVNNKSTVVSVFRDELVDYDSDVEIEKNSGFYSIYKSGMYFLENNIPKATASGSYFNPRLKRNNVRKYLGYDKSKEITDWKKCWVEQSSDSSSYYKSTLIIPMTLWNNKVSKEFKALINMDNVDRTIFGFLCFDHTNTNYFDEENDVSIGYVFADIISMFIFTRLIYMEISKTFSSVENWLDKNSINTRTKHLKSLWKSIPDNLDLDSILNFKIKKTTHNDLFPIDNDLLKFVRDEKDMPTKVSI